MEIGDVMGDFVKNYKKGEKQRKKYDEYLKNNDRKKLDEEAAAKGREKNKASSSNDKRQQASRNYMRNERKTVKHSGSYGKFGKGQQSFTSRSGSQRKKKTAFERVKDYFTGDYILKKDKDEWNRFDYITNGAMGEWLGGIIRAGEYLGDVTGLTKEKNPQKRKGSQLLREGSEYIDTAKKGTGKLGKVGIDIASQGVMMGLDRAVTLGRGKLSLLPMGVRAFGSSVEQAANSGADLKQQGLYGGLSAGVEIGTEGLFSGGSKLIYGGKGALDRVSETTAKKITDAAKRFVKTDKGQNVLYHAVKAGLAANEEGFEEVIADAVNPIIQQISYNDKALKQYGDPQYWKDSAYDYVIGAALGGIMGSGGQAIEYRAGRNMSRQQQEAEINKGLKSDESSESYSYANQLLNQSQRGENILPGQFYDLAKKNAAADNRAAKQYNDIYRNALDNETFRKAQEGFDEEDVERAKGIAAGRESNAAQQAKAVLLKQGVEETQADEYAQSIGRIVAGTANYTDTEVFQGNDAAKDAFKNVTGFALPADNESTRKQITQYAANATYNMAVNMRADIESEIAAENGGSFRASDGTVVETPVMITSPADVATFRKSVRKYTGEVAEKLAADYTGTVSAGSYTAAFNAFYDAGKIAYSNPKRFNFTWANKINSAWKEYLTANAARDAYLAGIKAARITEEKRVAAKTDIAKKGESKAEDKSNKLSETQKNMAKALAEKTGLDVTIAEKLHRVVDGANVQLNGAINVAMGTLELSLDSDNLGQALAHELTHYTYALNKEGAKELRDAVLSWYAEEKGMMSLSELLESKKQRYGDEVTAEEEFIADALAGLFSNDKGAESFAQWLTDKSGYSIEQQKAVLQKLIDVIDSIIANIKAMFTGNDLSKVSKDMRQLAKQNQQRAESVRKIYIDALNKASENYASAETGANANESSVKYSKKGEDSSIKKQLRANMEKLKDMKPVADVEYESIKNLNRSEKAKVIMNDYNKKFKDGIDRQDFGHIILREDEVTGSLKYLYTDGEFAAFKALPQVLKRGRVIDEHIDHKKRKIDTVTIAAPVVINGMSGYMAAAVKVGGKNRYHVHRILMPDGSEFEFNKKTEPTGAGMTTSKGRQGSAISPVSNKSISEIDKKSNEKYSIKEDSNDNSLSERQREYFKDSKVRDKDGKLMVLYHQTGNDFTVFDTKHEGAGSGDSGTPYGIFLKPTENDIGLSGNKQMPLYANITNPLIAADRGELDRILSENTEYKQVSDEHRKLDIDYKKKFEDAKVALTEYITEYKRKNPNASRSDIYNDPKFEEVWEAEDKIIEAWTAEADALSAKSKEIITNYLEAKGYDGVILEEDKGSFGRKTKAYIALHSEQVKNVDNTSPTTDKDIRFSIKETDRSTQKLLRENKKYKQLVADLKQQMRLSKGRIPDKGEINKYANRLRAEYSSKADKEQLINALTNLYGYMADKDAKADQVWDVARSIATDIITNSTYNKEISDYAKGILKDIKSSKVALSETQKQEVAYVYGSYTEYKRINKGVNTSDNGIYLDEKWQEWAEVYPELFDAELTEPEQGVRLAEITKALSEDYVNEFGFDLTDATDMLAAEIANEVAQTTEMVTFADKKKQQQAEKIAKEKAKNKEKINAIKQQYKEKYQQGMAEQREKHNQKLTAQRDKAKEQLARQKAKYEQRAADTRARADRRGVKMQIEKDVKYLTGMLLSPTDIKHIPEGYQSAIARMLAGFDFSTTRTDAWTKKYGHMSRRMLNFANLNAELLKIAESGESDIVVDSFITDLAEKLSKDLDGRRLDSLTNGELQDVKTLLKAVRYGIGNINRTFSDNIRQTRAEAADNIISETMQIKDKKHRSEFFKMFDDFLNSSNVKPVDFFEVMGGTAKEVFGSVVDGFDKHIRNVDTAMKYIQGVAAKKTLNRLSNDKMKPAKFKLESKETVELLPSQVMSLYCLMKRPEAVEHITKGGIVPTSLKYKKKFKTQGIIDDKRKQITYTDAVRIINSLTEEEKNIADKLQKFMAEDCAAWGNETSMKIHGYKKFKDPNYFPMKSDKDFLESRQTDKAELMPKLWTAGFTKALTPGANNPIMLDDIFNVVTRHITEMSMYNALAPALLDFERIYNYKQRGGDKTYYNGTTVKEQIRRAYGDKATNYINKLMRDLNNANKREDKVDTKIPNRLLANYKKAKIGFNFRVFVQQPTAIVRSAMMINPKYLMAAQGKPAIKEMQEHCPIAKWKGWGFYQTDVAPSMKEILLGQESKLDKLFMNAYGKADDFTWSYIWKAVKKEIEKNNPDIEPGSQEFWDRCNERARDIFYRTQVVDSMLSRSQIMRNDDTLMKMMTSFMAEPTTTFNMMRTETIKTAKEWSSGDKKAATKRIATLIPVFITNAVAVSAAAAIADYLRDAYTGDDDDEDKNLTPLQKYLKYTALNILDNANPLNMLPFTRDIYSLFSGYDVARMDMAAFATIYKDVERLQKTYEQGEDAKYTYEYCIRQLALHSGEIFGIPAANIVREIETTIKAAFPEEGKALIDKFMYADPDDVNRKSNYAALLSEDKDKSQSALEAIERDAESRYQKYIDEGKSESQAMSAVRSSLSNYYKGAYQVADTSERSTITSRISQISVNGRSVWEYADGTIKDFSEWDETE